MAGVAAATLLLHARMRRSSLEELLARVGPRTLAVVLALMALLVLTSLGGDMDAFLYFQF